MPFPSLRRRDERLAEREAHNRRDRPAEIAADAKACYEAGAAVIHIHLRDDQGGGFQALITVHPSYLLRLQEERDKRREFDLLVKEIHGDAAPEAMAALDQTRSDGVVMYAGLEVVFAGLPRFMPCDVSGAVQDELDLYNFKPKPPQPVAG